MYKRETYVKVESTIKALDKPMTKYHISKVVGINWDTLEQILKDMLHKETIKKFKTADKREYIVKRSWRV